MPKELALGSRQSSGIGHQTPATTGLVPVEHSLVSYPSPLPHENFPFGNNRQADHQDCWRERLLRRVTVHASMKDSSNWRCQKNQRLVPHNLQVSATNLLRPRGLSPWSIHWSATPRPSRTRI